MFVDVNDMRHIVETKEVKAVIASSLFVAAFFKFQTE
jgi:hypothetical protein